MKREVKKRLALVKRDVRVLSLQELAIVAGGSGDEGGCGGGSNGCRKER